MKSLYEIAFKRENVKQPIIQITHYTGYSLYEVIEKFKNNNKNVKIFGSLCYKCAPEKQ